MKQNIIMIIVLVILFLFGLVIYDFSDELDKSISDLDWYKVEGSRVSVLNFENQKFSYFNKEDGKQLEPFSSCKSFRYNRSINVIKLNCHISANKLYIVSASDNKLVMTINGEENVFYPSEKEAIKADFIKKNNLNEEDYTDLMEISFTDYNLINKDRLIEIYNSKEIELVTFVTKEETIQNALNIRALHNFIINSNTDVYLVDIDTLLEEDIKDLNKIKIDIKEIKENLKKSISIYNIGSKTKELITGIEVSTYGELSN